MLTIVCDGGIDYSIDISCCRDIRDDRKRGNGRGEEDDGSDEAHLED